MVGNRALAFIIDVVIYALIFVIIGAADFNALLDSEHGTMFFCILIVCMLSIFFKDIISGRSVGKRLLKLKIIGEDGKTPSTFRLILRNITIPIWLVEAILLLCGKIRIGDKLAGTKVENG
ncbi:MAG: RDD family protein [Clostridiales bacterium]|jgi:uncharacterized RDD family membrane protein YckC|nr:RDD family protein [Clostridiales bacterium]